jgi:hypothetical protein
MESQHSCHYHELPQVSAVDRQVCAFDLHMLMQPATPLKPLNNAGAAAACKRWLVYTTPDTTQL